MNYPKRVLIGLDQFINSILGGMPDETISAKVYRKARDKGGIWIILEKIINKLFNDSMHCYSSYLSERYYNQNHWSYRNDK